MALTKLTKGRARWQTFKLKVAKAVSRSLYEKLVEFGVHLKDFGADGSGTLDCTEALKAAVYFCKENGTTLRITGKDEEYRYSDTVQMEGINVKLTATLLQAHDGVGLHIKKNTTIDFGSTGKIVRVSDTFVSPTACLILLNKNDGDGGCSGNKLISPRLGNKFTPDIYPSITPKEQAKGKGLWIMAGANKYGLSDGSVYERCLDNTITDIHVRGFEHNICLEANYLTAKATNGWVNANNFRGAFLSEGKYLISLLCDGIGSNNKNWGETSGNTFQGINFQDDKGRITELFIKCEGYANSFQCVPWDVDTSRYPYFSFKRNGNKPNIIAPYLNTVVSSYDLGSRDNGNLVNGGWVEDSNGGNKVEYTRTATQNYFNVPLPPTSFGYLENPAHFPLVENYFAHAGEEQNKDFKVKVLKVSDSGSTDITGSVTDIKSMFTNDISKITGLPVSSDTKQLIIEVALGGTASLDIIGLTQIYGKQGGITGATAITFNSVGSIIQQIDIKNTEAATWRTNQINSPDCKKVWLRLDVDPSVASVINITNMFARAYNRQSNCYGVDRASDTLMFAPITFTQNVGTRIKFDDTQEVWQISVDRSTGKPIAIKVGTGVGL